MSIDKNALIAAVTRQAEKGNVWSETGSSSKDGQFFRPVFKGDQAKQDFSKMLNGLPSLIQDIIENAQVTEKLIQVIVQQQHQINELSNRIEEVTRASIALKAQENVHNILMKLTGQGSDVTKPEVTIRLSATMNTQSAETRENQQNNSTVETRAAQVAGNIQGILKDLIGLNLGVEVEKSEAFKEFQKLNEQTMSLRERSYQGDVQIRFESITGNPIVQAQAEAIKKGLAQIETKDNGVPKKRIRKSKTPLPE